MTSDVVTQLSQQCTQKLVHGFSIARGDKARLISEPTPVVRGRLMDVRNLNQVPAFITKDGSEIRELLAYRNSRIRKQSLAEARIPAGGATQEHYHPLTEEIYYLTAGRGRIVVGGETRDVQAGDAIAIPPGTRHKLWNTGAETLVLLCCCAPAYEHEDTVLTEERV